MQGSPAEQPFDYYNNCVHCGLCLSTCPTYAELGDENDSPRGRIYLMQAIEQGRAQPSPRIQHHLDLCLDCRACETVCPSGVQYGALIERYRTTINGDIYRDKGAVRQLIDWMLFSVLPYPRRTRWLLRLTRLLQRLRLFDLLRRTPLGRRYAAGLVFPKMLASSRLERSAIPVQPPADCSASTPVALFVGCVSESMLGVTNRAAWRVLKQHDRAVYCPADQRCCGAIHYHAGDVHQARAFARANIDAFESVDKSLDAIVVCAAGCGLMLKDYGMLLSNDSQYADRAAHFAARVAEICEYLDRLPPKPPGGGPVLRVAYHDACHLCHGQQVRAAPRRLLDAIPGVHRVELTESEWCCGAAGSYTLTQPEMASRLAARKLQHIDETGSQVVAAANVGCILHLQQHACLSGRNLRFVHPVDLLDQAYAYNK